MSFKTIPEQSPACASTDISEIQVKLQCMHSLTLQTTDGFIHWGGFFLHQKDSWMKCICLQNLKVNQTEFNLATGRNIKLSFWLFIFSVPNCSSLMTLTGSVIALSQVLWFPLSFENLDTTFVTSFYHKYIQTEFSLFHYFLPILKVAEFPKLA